eukprot:403366704
MESLKPQRSRSRESVNSDRNQDFKILDADLQTCKVFILYRKKNFCFQGATKIKVLYGRVNILGATITPEHCIGDKWFDVISDPRKNMLLSLYNQSKTEELEGLQLSLEGESEEIKIDYVPERASIIAIKEYKEYTESEQKNLLQADIQFNIPNMNRDFDEKKKGFFELNKSWKQGINNIVQNIRSQPDNQNIKILVNGVVNVGKSTFATCLINEILSQTKSDVFILEVDPGQPNYTLAGQLSLSKVENMILTNNDFNDIQILKSYYLNSPQPNLNADYYNKSIELLDKEYQNYDTQGRQKILIVNTCGWVEGIGAGIQFKITDIIQPSHIVTVMRADVGLQGNEFSQKCRQQREGQINFIDVKSDKFKGAMNVKGAVQRNKKIKKALTHQDEDRYIFVNKSQDGQDLPLVFNSKSMKHDDFSLSNEEFNKLKKQPFQIIQFKDINLCFITEQLDQVQNKIETLRLFENQLVAGIQIDKAQFKSLRSFEDVRVTEIRFTYRQLPPIEIKFYGLIRDIDFEGGIKLIPQNGIDLSKVEFNALCLCHDSIFRFPSTYLIQDQSGHIQQNQQARNEERKVFRGNNQDYRGGRGRGNYQNRYNQ